MSKQIRGYREASLWFPEYQLREERLLSTVTIGSHCYNHSAALSTDLHSAGTSESLTVKLPLLSPSSPQLLTQLST